MHWRLRGGGSTISVRVIDVSTSPVCHVSRARVGVVCAAVGMVSAPLCVLVDPVARRGFVVDGSLDVALVRLVMAVVVERRVVRIELPAVGMVVPLVVVVVSVGVLVSCCWVVARVMRRFSGGLVVWLVRVVGFRCTVSELGIKKVVLEDSGQIKWAGSTGFSSEMAGWVKGKGTRLGRDLGLAVGQSCTLLRHC